MPYINPFHSAVKSSGSFLNAQDNINKDNCYPMQTENIYTDNKNILRAQSPAAPRLRTVKQFIQAWNSLANCILRNVRHILNISWKSIHPP